MATNKTINPTNQTVQIPAMTDAPDASVFSNAISKTIDGVNTLNSQLGGMYNYKTGSSGSGSNTLKINLESTSSTREYMILGFGISSGQQLVGFILYARASQSLALIKTFGDRELTATYSSGTALIKGSNYMILNLICNYPITTEWTNT